VVGLLGARRGTHGHDDLMVRSGAQRRVSNHGPGYQSGDAFLWLKPQSARAASRRAQF
jgi:hypothetical protein